MQNILNDIHAQILPMLGAGEVASYIPALEQVPADQFGMAVCDVEGNTYHVGDAETPFSIQSISKLLSLTLALQIYGDDVWQGVDKEPSGQPFNSLIQLELEEGIPRNPFINAGAIKICDMLCSRLATPRQRMKEMVCRLSGNPLLVGNHEVADSEREHGARSTAIAYLMKAFNNFSNPVEEVLESYFFACSIEMSCVDLSRAFSFLANNGRSISTNTPVISPVQCKQINALLATCGMYDEAGDFAYRVGLPGKSGVGGGIIALIPGELTVTVWSPGLNASGNSLLGIKALELFTSTLGKSIY